MEAVERLKKFALRIGICGGIATFIAMNSIPYLYYRRLCQTEEYNEAVKLLHSHPEAAKYLGEPIKEGRVNTTSKDDFGFDEEKMWVSMPVFGSKAKGRLYYEFPLKKSADEHCKLSRVELTLTHLKDRKLLIKKPEAS